MSSHELFLIIMAGGSGTRFWPKSTSKRPKQLLSFGKTEAGKKPKTLIEQTLDRFSSWVPEENCWILTTEALKGEMERLSLKAQIFAEPQGRNTAPCIYWAARKIADQNPSAVMMIMPSDHYIAGQDAFLETLKRAIARAQGHPELVTLGIKPSRPETGYGYLKTDGLLGDYSADLQAQRVEAFVEKPNLENAQEFLRSGNYLWNGGMFLWRAQVILDAFDQFMPEMKKAWDESHGDVRVAYPKMTATSIDFGVMEKAKNVVTFPLNCGWDDLGSWTSLETLSKELGAQVGENTVAAGELVSIDSSGNIIDAPERLVALLGIHDVVLANYGGVLLLIKKTRTQELKQILELVKEKDQNKL